jgi:2'-5' RNA ligase
MGMISSIWLIPEQKDEDYISAVIQGLSQKYATLYFTPHITIYGEIEKELDVVIEAAKNAVRNVRPFMVNVEKLDYSEAWSKTLFIQLQQNQTINLIHARLREKLSHYSDYKFNPHISLIYKKDMTAQNKIEEIKALSLKTSYMIDRIAIISPLNKRRGWHDISKWKILFMQQL